MSEAQAYPDNNPKTVQGLKKAPIHLVPPVAIAHTAMAFKDGAAKYGPYNWREKSISSSVYYAAAQRHLMSWWDGENVAADSGVSHIGHALACLAMILDGAEAGKLNDDRPIPGSAAAVLARFAGAPQFLVQQCRRCKNVVGGPDEEKSFAAAGVCSKCFTASA